MAINIPAFLFIFFPYHLFALKNFCFQHFLFLTVAIKKAERVQAFKSTPQTRQSTAVNKKTPMELENKVKQSRDYTTPTLASALRSRFLPAEFAQMQLNRAYSSREKYDEQQLGPDEHPPVRPETVNQITTEDTRASNLQPALFDFNAFPNDWSDTTKTVGKPLDGGQFAVGSTVWTSAEANSVQRTVRNERFGNDDNSNAEMTSSAEGAFKEIKSNANWRRRQNVL